jgi:hypothetical protein
LVGNKGYRRYLKLEGSGHFAIDEEQVKAEQRYDGIWVLRTNTDYNAETVAHVYKALWTVEDIIRTTKSILETRPIYRIDWHLLQYPLHEGLRRLVQHLNFLYKSEQAFSEDDDSYAGFEWIDLHDADNSIFTFARKGRSGSTLPKEHRSEALLPRKLRTPRRSPIEGAGRLSHRSEDSAKRHTTPWTPRKVLGQRIYRR